MKKKLLLCLMGISAISAFTFGCKTSVTEEVSNRNTVYLTGEFPAAEDLEGGISTSMDITGGVETLINSDVKVDIDKIYNETEDELTKVAIDEFRNNSDVLPVLERYLSDELIEQWEFENMSNPETVEFLKTQTCSINIQKLETIPNFVTDKYGIPMKMWDENLEGVANSVMKDFVLTGEVDSKGYDYLLCRMNRDQLGTDSWISSFVDNCGGFESVLSKESNNVYAISVADIYLGNEPMASYCLIIVDNKNISDEEYSKNIIVVPPIDDSWKEGIEDEEVPRLEIEVEDNTDKESVEKTETSITEEKIETEQMDNVITDETGAADDEDDSPAENNKDNTVERVITENENLE